MALILPQSIFTATVPRTNQASVSSFDTPQIAPGPAWFDLFKPQWSRPRPYLLDAGQPSAGSVSSTGASLSRLLSSRHKETRVPLTFRKSALVLPGCGCSSSTSRSLHPYLPRSSPRTRREVSLLPQSHSLRKETKNSPDIPQVQPGPAWFRRFKPGLYKPVPPVPAYQAVSGTGSFNLAPVAFSAAGSQSSPDVTPIAPGTTWLRLFRPDLYKPVPVPPGQRKASAGQADLAPRVSRFPGAGEPDFP